MLFVFAMFSTPTFTAFTAIVEPTVVFSSAKYCGIYSSVGVAGKVFCAKSRFIHFIFQPIFITFKALLLSTSNGFYFHYFYSKGSSLKDVDQNVLKRFV